MNDSALTPKQMKKTILRAIRTTLIDRRSATKVELSEMLDISFPTISKFLTEMEKEGEILSLGLDDSSGGRRAKRYAYNPEHQWGLALYLEQHETNYTIFNSMGEVKEQGQTDSVLRSLHQLTLLIESVVNRHPKIHTISIGVPGSVDQGRIFFIPGYEEFQNLDLKRFLEEHFSIPVVVENDMNAAVLGYQKDYQTYERPTLVYLYSGKNGPGAGIMVNGEVVRGSTFFAGEISFVPQYDRKNFGEALHTPANQVDQIDAIGRLIASFVAMINPHAVIFGEGDLTSKALEQIIKQTSTYIPSEHMPKLTLSDWKHDYLNGLQRLCLEKLMNQ